MVQVIKSRTRHGWNINGMNVPNWQQLKTEAKKNPPRWTLIMDSIDKAREWKDEIGGEVTYRAWSTNEDYYHRANDPKATAQQMARHTEKVVDCWQYWHMNEPGSSGTVTGWLGLQDWLIAYATEAKKLNRKVTTNGLAILKNWTNPEFVKAGHCDKLIRYWADNRDTFILNVHTYVTGAAWSTISANYPLNLFDLNITRTGKNNHINWTSYEPIMWYHREAWVTNVRARDIIGEPMDFIIDECWFDWHSSVHDQHVTIDGKQVQMSTELRARYGDTRFNRDMRGILGQRKFGEWAITGNLNTPVSDDRYCDWVIENYQWLENEYPDNALAFMNFTMNPNWRYPQGHDAIPLANALLPRMATIKPRQSTPPPPVEPPQERTMRPIQIKGYNKATSTPVRVNIRTNPNAAATILGQLPSDPVVTSCYVSESPPIPQGGWTWQYYEGVKTVAGATVNGYMASELVEEITITTPPAEPKLFFDIKGLTYLKTQTEWDTFCVDVATLAALLPTIEGKT